MTGPRTAFVLALVAGLATACGPKNLHLALGEPLAAAPSSIGLAEPILLTELERLEPMDAFHQGFYVGNIWFSGGFELMPEEDNQVRSVGVDLQDTEPYAGQARSVVGDTFTSLLVDHELSWQAIQDSVERAVSTPRKLLTRGSGPFDGRDNQNLPRFGLQPLPLDVGELPELPPGTSAVLVPVVVHYYTHNGGWFVGQNLGCAAGARVRVLWSLHDAMNGRVLTWGEVGVQHQQEYYYSPNAVELQDYQLIVEAELARWLDEQLPR
jgi:hypothetical protein